MQRAHKASSAAGQRQTQAYATIAAPQSVDITPSPIKENAPTPRTTQRAKMLDNSMHITGLTVHTMKNSTRNTKSPVLYAGEKQEQCNIVRAICRDMPAATILPIHIETMLKLSEQ